ncbi:hypothetical protein IAU60_003892 [Kwoniella sp. DSM 27419]
MTPLTDLPEHPTLTQLPSLAASSQVLFRIHTTLSVSPLIWTGKLSTSGFASPNIHLASSLHASFTPLDSVTKPPPTPTTTQGGLVLRLDPYLRHTILDHVHSRSRQTCLPILSTIQEKVDGVWMDDRTPWVSACSELFWCVWEVARRLSVPEDDPGRVENVHMAVIRHPAVQASWTGWRSSADRTGGSSTRGTMVPSHASYLRPDRSHTTAPLGRPRELYVHAADHLGPSTQPGIISASLKEQYAVARKAALDSGEVLFFGRIWADNVLLDLEWTRESLPFELPSFMFKDDCLTLRRHAAERAHVLTPRRREQDDPPHSWLDDLVWDPKVDEHLTAREKVVASRRMMSGQGRDEGGPWLDGLL